MVWEKIERTVNSEGTTITYAAEGTNTMLIVQSRKRHIEHANSVGTWDFTTYHVIIRGKEIQKIFHRMAEAKAYAEDKWNESVS